MNDLLQLWEERALRLIRRANVEHVPALADCADAVSQCRDELLARRCKTCSYWAVMVENVNGECLFSQSEKTLIASEYGNLLVTSPDYGCVSWLPGLLL